MIAQEIPTHLAEVNSDTLTGRDLPLSQVLYQGTLPLTDPDVTYEQYMKIGIK